MRVVALSIYLFAILSGQPEFAVRVDTPETFLNRRFLDGDESASIKDALQQAPFLQESLQVKRDGLNKWRVPYSHWREHDILDLAQITYRSKFALTNSTHPFRPPPLHLFEVLLI